MTAGHVGGDAAMRATAQAGLRSRKSMLEMSVGLYGADEAAAGWDCDGWTRAKVQRLVHHACSASDEGPHNAAPGTR